MNSDSENFEQLRRLLALKRYEQPPPRYFVDFSSQVLARIRAGEDATFRLETESTWWQRLWSAFEARPVFAGGFGAAVCAVLVSGIFISSEPTSVNLSTELPPDLKKEIFTRDARELVQLPPEMTDSNSLVLKAMFDSFQLQGQPVNVTVPWPRN
jgi:hypothetical protein